MTDNQFWQIAWLHLIWPIFFFLNKCGNQIDFAKAIMYCVLRFFCVSIFYYYYYYFFFNFRINQLDWHNRDQHAGYIAKKKCSFVVFVVLSLVSFDFLHFISFYINRIFKWFMVIEAQWKNKIKNKWKTGRTIIYSPGN